jgi:hypothetical protein
MANTTKRELSDRQLGILADYQSRQKLTEAQREEMEKLITKRDAPPELAVVTISYLKELATAQETGRRKEIETMRMLKGTEQENESIGILNALLGTKYKKYDGGELSNDYITGNPDIYEEYVYTDDDHISSAVLLRDIKSSSTVFTHPYYDEENPHIEYFYQLQGYMWLTGAKESFLDYILVNTPEWQIQKQIKSKYFELVDRGFDGGELATAEHESELLIRFHNTFDDLPLERRVKTFTVYRSEKVIERIKQQIELIRNFNF